MGWKIVEVEEEDGSDVLTDGELVGISILVGRHEEDVEGKHPAHMDADDLRLNVYARAWTKIQSAVNVAIERD